jgi:hypothetical protein
VPVGDLPLLLDEVVSGRHGRSPSAVCAIELRSPAPMSWKAFDEFNAGYVDMLDALGITVDGANPVARTNVVPILDPPTTHVVDALCFTVPRTRHDHQTFVVAGAAEVRGNQEEAVVRSGETSPDALGEKAALVLDQMTERMAALGATRDQLAAAHVYTPHMLDPGLCLAIGRATGARDGSFRIHVARPPITGLEFEMDMRSVAAEEVA